MKLYQFVLLLLFVSFLQVSWFYTDIGSVSINILLVVSWILYLTNEKSYSIWFAFCGGLLVDSLRLSGIGTLSFVILLPLAVYMFTDTLVQFKGTLWSHVLMLFLVILSGLLYVTKSFLVGEISSFDPAYFQVEFLTGLFSWISIEVMTLLILQFGKRSKGPSYVEEK